MAKWPMGRVLTGTLGMTIDLKDTYMYPYAREKYAYFKNWNKKAYMTYFKIPPKILSESIISYRI